MERLTGSGVASFAFTFAPAVIRRRAISAFLSFEASEL